MAGTAFALILGSTILGAIVRARLPEHHLTGNSKEVIRLATALVATLTALVLALLFAATRTSFEHTSASVSRLVTDITELDDVLAEYGPDAASIRRKLRDETGPAGRFDLARRCDRGRPAGCRPPGARRERALPGARAAAEDTRPGVAPDARPADRHRLPADPPRPVRPASGLGLHAVHDRPGRVADVPVHHLQHVVEAQSDARHRPGSSASCRPRRRSTSSWSSACRSAD